AGTRQPSSTVLPNHGRMFPPLLWERAGVRGNRTPAVLAASALDSAPDRTNGYMALSSLRLLLGHLGLSGCQRRLEGEKGFEDAETNVVHLRLQLVQILVETALDDFVDAR